MIGQNSVVGLRAIVAAGRQNKLWDMNEALYANQGKENSGWITSPTRSSRSPHDLGLNTKKLVTDANSKAVTKLLEAAARRRRRTKLQARRPS